MPSYVRSRATKHREPSTSLDENQRDESKSHEIHCCFLGVAFGAFGTHLEDKITSEQLEWWSTATIIFGITAWVYWPLVPIPAAEVLLKVSQILIIGIVVFCGSLYAYSHGLSVIRYDYTYWWHDASDSWMRASWCFAIRKNSQEREEK